MSALFLTVTLPFDYWGNGAGYLQARGWLERALAHASAVPVAVRARARVLGAYLALQQGDLAAGERLLEQAEPLALQLGASAELAHAAWLRGWISVHQGNSREAIGCYERGLAVLTRLPQPDLHIQLSLLINLGHHAVLGGDTDRAEAACRQILEITEPPRSFTFEPGPSGYAGLSPGVEASWIKPLRTSGRVCGCARTPWATATRSRSAWRRWPGSRPASSTAALPPCSAPPTLCGPSWAAPSPAIRSGSTTTGSVRRGPATASGRPRSVRLHPRPKPALPGSDHLRSTNAPSLHRPAPAPRRRR